MCLFHLLEFVTPKPEMLNEKILNFKDAYNESRKLKARAVMEKIGSFRDWILLRRNFADIERSLPSITLRKREFETNVRHFLKIVESSKSELGMLKLIEKLVLITFHSFCTYIVEMLGKITKLLKKYHRLLEVNFEEICYSFKSWYPITLFKWCKSVSLATNIF